ncbi:DUF72 domain-containing protein [Schauerella aestuarii]|uniref:DUF72 domain-containing protein n=1 Tax=Schauerella aestuarii TaxID=2511204 RepID=UPI00136AA28B|nr:DUF72 domain-containing protein [Achromobacter aestuarii]MYZ45762.1 DUF72 domain-containing protein [Achromobacter aestuarii]
MAPSVTPARTTALRIGISGWRYPPWRGTFYPDDLRQADELLYASHQLPTIEINGTFYSLQTPERFATWAASTPSGFVFSVKAPRYITHIRRLRDIEEPLANFFASGLFALKEKLGPVLWQFPPSLAFDQARFEAFARALPADTEAAERLAHKHSHRLDGRAMMTADAPMPLRHAIEVRHESFVSEAFIDLMKAHNIAIVTADTAGKWPRISAATADFAYVRLHGDSALYSSGYTEDAIAAWAHTLYGWSRGEDTPLPGSRVGAHPPADHARDVYCYFDNDLKVKSPRDARRLMSALHLPMAPIET